MVELKASVEIKFSDDDTVLQKAKCEVLPGLEPGTFSVLTRCHDQLDHSTKLSLLEYKGALSFDILQCADRLGIGRCFAPPIRIIPSADQPFSDSAYPERRNNFTTQSSH